VSEFEVTGGGVSLRGDDDGDGVPVLLLHGLSATRRYVLHGSNALQRDGFRVIAYDSRGHGQSSPGPTPDSYGYAALVEDAVRVMDDRGVARAAVVGMSMGSAVGWWQSRRRTWATPRPTPPAGSASRRAWRRMAPTAS
jgi:pimeloyl-ACP methyl ester carboxylesterase